MQSHLLKLSILLILPAASEAQLHLISGTANPKGDTPYAFDLLRVTPEGGIEQVQSLSHPGIGTEHVEASFDLRKAVLLTKTPSRLVVVDFDRAAIAKECEIPPVPEVRSLIDEWLVDVPTIGAKFEQHLGGADLNKHVVQSMTLDSTIDCDHSFAISDASDLKHIRAQSSGRPVFIENNGVMTIGFAMRLIALETVVPPALLREIDLSETGSAGIWVNDAHLLVLSAKARGVRQLILVLRKRDEVWKRVRVNESSVQILRGFGRYLAIVEMRPEQGASDEVPGRAEWRAKEARRGPALTESIGPLGMPVRGGGIVLAGVLHLYDSESERTYRIVTNQADSEIILVDNGLVYYRVSDRLFSAPIEEGKLGKPTLVATSDAIRDAHWAFMKRSGGKP